MVPKTALKSEVTVFFLVDMLKLCTKKTALVKSNEAWGEPKWLHLH